MKLHEHIQTQHPEKLHDSLGTSRVCEWQALARIADQIGAGSYCSVGCDGGLDFLSLKSNYKEIAAIGFDVESPKVANMYDQVEWYQMDSSPDDVRLMHEILAGFLKQHKDLGPTLFYVNNRYKVEMLRQLVRHVRVGSVIGTHDWGADKMTVAGTFTEVPERRCGFLYEQGFQVYQPIEPWLTRNKCIQKFWVKK